MWVELHHLWQYTTDWIEQYLDTICKIKWQSKPRCCIKLFKILNPTFSVYIIVLCPENASNDTVTFPNWIPCTDKINTYLTPARIPVFEWILYQEHTFTDKRQNTRNRRQIRVLPLKMSFGELLKTGFARDSGHERTFSKLSKVIQVQWKLPKQKDFYVLIYGSFNQHRLSLLSNVSGDFGHKCRRLPMTRWKCRRK